MSSAKIRQLLNYVPGFKLDRDEEWACYLPVKDQKFLRKCRSHYTTLKDILDGYKSELKDCKGDSQQTEPLQQKIKDLTKQIDTHIATSLITIPDLKRIGLEAREKRIEDDLRMGRADVDSSRLEPSLEDESDMLDSLGAFMPRTHIDEPSTSTSNRAVPEPTGPDQEQDDADYEMGDPYIDDVDPDFVDIMEKMRFFVDNNYAFRDDVLEVLTRVRKRDENVGLLGTFKKLESQQKGAVVPMQHDG